MPFDWLLERARLIPVPVGLKALRGYVNLENYINTQTMSAKLYTNSLILLANAHETMQVLTYFWGVMKAERICLVSLFNKLLFSIAHSGSLKI